jgi:hypothetical protein
MHASHFWILVILYQAKAGVLSRIYVYPAASRIYLPKVLSDGMNNQPWG